MRRSGSLFKILKISGTVTLGANPFQFLNRTKIKTFSAINTFLQFIYNSLI